MRPRIQASVSKLCLSSSCFRPVQYAVITRPVLPAHRAFKGTLAAGKKHHDPYVIAQIKLRRDANLSRQIEIKKERKLEMGDAVRGITTPYLESFDTVGGSVGTESQAQTGNESKGSERSEKEYLNYYVTPSELDAAVMTSHFLSSPLVPKNRLGIDPLVEKQKQEMHEVEHHNALEAMKRILSLSNASSKEKTRTNIMRCIEMFGRHNTDKILKPRPPVNPSLLKGKVLAEKTPRAGPDTGSSEVQVAILTAKIRVLADNLEQGGSADKVNKRNLRLLVHRRQKHLQYLRRKERGGERWQNVVKTLGLTDGTWKGEISLP